MEGRVAGKAKADGDAEDGLDDLFGDVGGEDTGSDSSVDSESDDLVAETGSRKPGRAAGAVCDMGDGLTLHDGRLVIEVSALFSCVFFGVQEFDLVCRSEVELSDAAVKMWLQMHVIF